MGQSRGGVESDGNSAIAMGGYDGTASTNATEEWEGPGADIGAWSTSGNLNTGREYLASSGTQTAGLAFGGYTTTSVANTETYNGSSWTEVADLNTARTELSGDGTSTSSLAIS